MAVIGQNIIKHIHNTKEWTSILCSQHNTKEPSRGKTKFNITLDIAHIVEDWDIFRWVFETLFLNSGVSPFVF